ncbi:Bet v I domain [Macleaya cordata]|uniref:Bet v I domain n=1 Tax=Macleaya cordata TaxID=56857 RepID=A0A200PU45_MACCD|nr:Bet v I domain [Macleaya cordata]
MAQIHCHDVETEVNCSADKIYDLFKNNMIQFPKIFPEAYKSAEVLEGDGKSVGTVRLWKYVLGGSPDVLEAKETIKAVDDENRSITLSIVEGDVMNHYESFDVTVTVTPKDGVECGCLVKWSVECGHMDNINSEDIPANSTPDAYKDVLAALSQVCASHLLDLA